MLVAYKQSQIINCRSKLKEGTKRYIILGHITGSNLAGTPWQTQQNKNYHN
jgi:hypothetical protein